MYETQGDMGRIQEQPGSDSMLRGVGYGCIVIGVLIGLWIFFRVYGFIEEPSSFERYGQLLAEPLEVAANVEGKDANIVFPFEPFGYVLAVILLGIVVKIAGMFLSAGAKLLDRDTTAYMKKLSKAQTTICEQIETIQTNIKNRGVR